MPRKFLVLFFVISNYSMAVKAQNITYYPFNSLLSFSSDYRKPVWLDLRMQTNSYFSSLATEIAPAITISSKEKANIYLGLGARFNFLAAAVDPGSKLLEGYMLNLGVRSQPFDKIPRLILAFEVSPYANSRFDLGLMRAHLGLGYNFSKK